MTQPTVIYRVPASFEQQVWFAEAEGGGGNMNLVVALRVVGPFDRRVFEQAVLTLVERHEALRTTLHRVQGGVEQAIWDSLSCPIADLDIESSPDTIEAALVEFADAAMQVPDGELFSTVVFALGPRSNR